MIQKCAHSQLQMLAKDFIKVLLVISSLTILTKGRRLHRLSTYVTAHKWKCYSSKGPKTSNMNTNTSLIATNNTIIRLSKESFPIKFIAHYLLTDNFMKSVKFSIMSVCKREYISSFGTFIVVTYF